MERETRTRPSSPDRFGTGRASRSPARHAFPPLEIAKIKKNLKFSRQPVQDVEPTQRSVGRGERAYARDVVLRHGQQVVIGRRADVFEDADALVLEHYRGGRVRAGRDLAEYAPLHGGRGGSHFEVF